MCLSLLSLMIYLLFRAVSKSEGWARVLSEFAFVTAFLLYGRGLKGMSADQLGLKVSLRHWTWTVILIPIATVGYLLVLCLVHESYAKLLSLRVRTLTICWASWAYLDKAEALRWLCHATLINVCEELLFRGALLGCLLHSFPRFSAIWIQACLFGSAHYIVWGRDAVMPACFFGLVTGWMMVRLRSLIPCIAVHIALSWILILWFWGPRR